MKPELPIPDNLTWDEYEALAKNYLNQKNKYMVPINILGAQPFKRLSLLKNNANLIELKYNYMETYYDRALRMQKDQSQMDFGTAKINKK